MQWRVLVTLVVLLAVGSAVQAQNAASAGTGPGGFLGAGPEAALAARVAVPPRVDGRDDDPAWREARPVTDFVVFAPREGGTPSVRTEARFLYDNRAIYVVVRAFDPHPDSIVRRLARRDNPDPTSDQVLLFLDPYHDRRSGYGFVVTAGGVKYDETISNDGDEDGSWDGIWDVATAVDSLGWVAEFAIPLQQLRFARRPDEAFGVMVGRWVGRSGERMSWPQYRRSLAGLASQFGTLSGLQNLAPPASIQVTPYTLARARDAGVGDGVRGHAAGGGDLKWLPRPSLSLDATVNPDFGQIEADPAVLDLSGTEVFQAERRPFFLEGAGLLQLPLAEGASARLFYSRRIGRRPALVDAFGEPDSPTETTILGAARVTARLAGSTSFAGLSAFTQGERGAMRPDSSGRYVIEPAAHYEVARLQQDFRQGRSGIGVMLTRVDRSSADSVAAAALPSSATAVAVTTQHQSSDHHYLANAWLAVSEVRGTADAITGLKLSPVHEFQRPDDGLVLDTSGTSLRGKAFSLSVAKVGGGMTRFDASYRRIAPGFDVNQMGFLTRSGQQTWTADAGLNRGESGTLLGVPFRRADVTLGFAGNWTAGEDLLALGRMLTLTGHMELRNQMKLQAVVSRTLSGGYCTVACTRGGPALRTEPHSEVYFNLAGDPRRALVPELDLQWEWYDAGRSHNLTWKAGLTWHVRSNLEAFLSFYSAYVRDAAQFYGRFGDPLSDTAHYTVAYLKQETRTLTGRVNYTLLPTLTLQWYGQAFLSRGTYSDVRELADPRAGSWDRRFLPYADSTVRAQPGGIDFKQLRSNLVLRWEYRPGSTFFVVWTQERDLDARRPGSLGLWPGRDLGDLFSLPARNTVAFKASYWFSL